MPRRPPTPESSQSIPEMVDELTRQEIATQLKISESSVLSAMNALQEVGLLKREGYGKGRHWIVKTSAT
jgi:Mn-dependent DtxR family transcriptional regulator